MSKRKRTATAAVTSTPTLPPPPQDAQMSSIATSPEALNIKYNNPGDHCFDLFDAEGATRASPDSPLTSPPPSEELGLWEVELENGDDDEGFKPELHDESPVEEEIVQGSRGKKKRKTATGTATGGKKQTTKNKKVTKKGKKTEQDEEEEGMIEDVKLPPTKKKSKPKKVEGGEEDDEAPVERSLPVNSDYLPLPWKGRLGYACLNTYLRASNPPIFCSRTCRIDTILKHGSEGQKYVESLGLANAKDLKKLIEWNEKYGIKFLRISSEMFPFASHAEYGYTLEFAKDALAEAGSMAMKYGHRLSMHPGQFTQLGSPRKEVVLASVRDLEYHCQLLSLLGLEGQTDKDAVLILHMGGVFGDREATLNRFKENYTTLLSDDIKARLVLENDDMCWNVHELLPVCKELNIPLVLDWHHHNIVRVPEMREGTLDILQLMPEIKETWIRKGITQKQHYSEAKYPDGSANKRRRHSPRVQALPPCEPTMDLMIEAKDKEQAVFELMKIFKLDGWDRFAEVLPHIREDENKPEPKRKKAAPKKPAKKRGKRAEGEADTNVQDGEEGGSEAGIEENGEPAVPVVPDNELGMGGSERRVYWPEGMEHWLSPPKRIRKKKEEAVGEGNSEVVDDDEKDLNGDVDGDSSKKTMRKGSTEVVTEGLPEEVQPSTLGGRKKEKIKAEELAVVELPDPAKGSRGRRSGRARKVVVSYADES